MKYISNRKEVDKAIQNGTEKGLIKVGILLQSTAVKILTKHNHVDTGRLRGSVTYVVGKIVGNLGKNADSGDKPRGSVNKNQLYFGTNVKYARFIEYIHSFIKNALKFNQKEINEILQKEMEDATND